MLLNEFLNEHREAEEQEHKLAAQDRLQQNATIRPVNEKLRFYPVIAVPLLATFFSLSAASVSTCALRGSLRSTAYTSIK